MGFRSLLTVSLICIVSNARRVPIITMGQQQQKKQNITRQEKAGHGFGEEDDRCVISSILASFGVRSNAGFVQS